MSQPALRPTAPDIAGIALRLPAAVQAADRASEVLLRHYGKLAGFDEKSPVDLVTIADRESEAVVQDVLRKAFADDRILAEEADGPDGAREIGRTAKDLPWTWVVDPLDGTTNFAHTHVNFCVSIGLLHFGQPVLGVVDAPARGERYVGGLGIPPTCNGTALRVSTVTDLGHALVGTGFPYDRRRRMERILTWLGRVLHRVHDVRRGGSAALDLCELAAGRLDGFYEPGLMPWDLCAGVAILEAAGGRVTGFDGAPHDLFAGWTVASNGRVHDELVGLLGD
jgi:myo-inositol-1(or 4)-monophosphatase